ncbi:MAG: TssQ family T6SS-associated lipoprotein [Betaproteobacteria bacterium]|nr:TssQ family T6SS-associated lipoprotein [Betaproteobacteria bacterium]
MQRPPSTRSTAWQAGAAAAFALAMTACAPLGQPPPGSAAAPPVAVGEPQLRERAKENLDLGLRQYERGEYRDAETSLAASLDHGLLSAGEQSAARKYLAFIFCVSEREARCRDEFRKALEIDPAFNLGTAEIGHPVWGPIYRNVREQLASAAAPAAQSAAQPAPKPAAPMTPAGRLLADGLAKYDAGEFAAAFKLLQGALKEGLAEKPDRIRAHKHAAFSLCLLRRYASCRGEFMKIFAIDPEFDLAPAEASHPSWTKTFAAAKRRAAAARPASRSR